MIIKVQQEKNRLLLQYCLKLGILFEDGLLELETEMDSTLLKFTKYVLRQSFVINEDADINQPRTRSRKNTRGKKKVKFSTQKRRKYFVIPWYFHSIYLFHGIFNRKMRAVYKTE